MSEKMKQELKEYQKNYRKTKRISKTQHNYFICIFFHSMKMRKELVFRIKNNSYTKPNIIFKKIKTQLTLMR